MDDEVSPKKGAQDQPELALDLNFVPTWARKPPENPYGGREEFSDARGDRPGRRNDRRGGPGRRDEGFRRGPRPGGDVRRPGGFRSGGGGRPAGAGGFSGRGDSRPGGRAPSERTGERGGSGGSRAGQPRRDFGDRRPFREARPRLDVKVSFLPDRERLALVVRDIQAGRRAFPLAEIASRFLSRDDLYLVKLELKPPPDGSDRAVLFQCLECKRVFRVRANAEAHVLSDHLDRFFGIEETEAEPPTGVFTCVARCRLSGTLLGPPNHHGYNEKIQELWSTRYAHLSKAEYLGQIETLRDEALVEQWKDSLRKKTVYRLKDPPEGQEAEAMTRPEAQAWMRGRVNAMLRESPRCMVPGTQSKKFDDGALRAAVSAAWQKESRFPLTLILALRPAFRHMHLHLFKVNAKETYVTAIPPVPVDLETSPGIVKEIVAFLEAHPGIPRQQVLEGLRTGADPESTEAAEVLLHLGNLVANGGVIEFFNGTLALPRAGAPRSASPKPAADQPDQPGADETDAAADNAVAAETPAGATDPGTGAPGGGDVPSDARPETAEAVQAVVAPADSAPVDAEPEPEGGTPAAPSSEEAPVSVESESAPEKTE